MPLGPLERDGLRILVTSTDLDRPHVQTILAVCTRAEIPVTGSALSFGSAIYRVDAVAYPVPLPEWKVRTGESAVEICAVRLDNDPPRATGVRNPAPDSPNPPRWRMSHSAGVNSPPDIKHR